MSLKYPGELLGRFRGFSRIGLQCRYYIDPVEGLQLVEVYDVVVHQEGALHEVADHLGVWGYDNAQSVLDGSYRT